MFSGTGGTALVAARLEQRLIDANCRVDVLSLEDGSIEQSGRKNTYEIDSIDMIILLFPVHAFDAPEPIYRWLRTLQNSKHMPVAIISIDVR